MFLFNNKIFVLFAIYRAPYTDKLLFLPEK